MFSMSNGSVKPSNCLHLGLVMKSITGSRKVIEILNRMGHSISYTVAEEIETELAYGCSENSFLPSGLIAHCPTLHTHVAFDNYDRYVDAGTGKDTPHDTVGIAFQNIDKEATPIIRATNLSDNHENCSDERLTGRRRRKFISSLDTSLQPYIKGYPKVECFFGKDPVTPANLKFASDIPPGKMKRVCAENVHFF